MTVENKNPTTINDVPINNDTVLSGLLYSLLGIGGYVAEQGIQNISLNPVSKIARYDVTNSVQVKIDVEKFNTKIGIVKDPSTGNIISSSYNSSIGKFDINTIDFSASDFLDELPITPPFLSQSVSQIVSVGKLDSLYSDFNSYINEYFSYANGFTTLFDLSNNNNIIYNNFGAEEFIKIIHGSTINNTGEYVNDLSGNITINNITEIIEYLIYQDPFNNRTNQNLYSDALTKEENVKKGFIEGDLFFLPDGLTITLNLNISNNEIYLNYLGETKRDELDNNYNYSTYESNPNFSSTIIHSGVQNQTNIKKVIKLPLLIKLFNKFS